MSATDLAARTAHYLSLEYPVSIRALTEEEGGGYVATIPQLGSRAFMAVGETRLEALEALDALREYLIPELLSEGVELSEPRVEEYGLEQYSGNLMLRIPRSLHARLAEEAKRCGCSLNKLATQLLSQNLERESLVREVRGLLEELRQTEHQPRQQKWLKQPPVGGTKEDNRWMGNSYDLAA